MKYQIYLMGHTNSQFDTVEAMSFEQNQNFINFFNSFNLPGMGKTKINVSSYNAAEVFKITNVDNSNQVRQVREKKLLRLKDNSFFKKLFKFTWLKK